MTDHWAEGKYVDLWTVNHFVCGFIVAGWLLMMGVLTGPNIVIASVMFWGWEMVERMYAIEEITNQAADLVADYAGYGLFFALAPMLGSNLVIVLIAASAVFAVLEFYGYRAYRKRR